MDRKLHWRERVLLVGVYAMLPTAFTSCLPENLSRETTFSQKLRVPGFWFHVVI